MKIGKMSLDDLSRVKFLASQLGYPVSRESLTARFHAVANHPDSALLVARTDQGQVVGWGHVNKKQKSLITEDAAEVAVLVVDENFRGKGIGKLLLREMENWAKQNRLKRLSLLSNSKRTDAHRFYIREGYEVSKLSNVFAKILE